MSDETRPKLTMDEIAESIEYSSDALELIYALRLKHELAILIADDEIYDLLQENAKAMSYEFQPRELLNLEYDIKNHEIFRTQSYSPIPKSYRAILDTLVKEAIVDSIEMRARMAARKLRREAEAKAALSPDS